MTVVFMYTARITRVTTSCMLKVYEQSSTNSHRSIIIIASLSKSFMITIANEQLSTIDVKLTISLMLLCKLRFL